ncbi:Innexin inx7 [Blattella germanica]|nr:Innexin inx7 [Blattella germanica]
MIKTFDILKAFSNVKKHFVAIDGVFFKLFYRFEWAILCLSVILITVTQYNETGISCYGGKSDTEYLNTYCFLNGTFTVPSRTVQNTGIPFRGVGHYDADKEDVKDHKYYQWLPWFLLFQIFLSYLPHAIWKCMEGGILEKTVNRLEFAYDNYDGELALYLDNVTQEQSFENIQQICDLILDTIKSQKKWAYSYNFCEFFNVVCLIIQIFLTDIFLGNQFLTLGYDLIFSSKDILDEVFPKMAKCTFYSYGSSGTIQSRDALCVLPMNYISYIVFPIVWFCYSFLLVASAFIMLQVIISVCLYSRSVNFNKLMFGFSYPNIMSEECIKSLLKKFDFADWIFLDHVSRNMDVFLFHELLRLAATRTPKIEIVSTIQPDIQKQDQTQTSILRRSRHTVEETGL